jgi:carlactone synthase/all-trans-10'-apo-beta-carotenal 13,14-cleaving dioxygenase
LQDGTYLRNGPGLWNLGDYGFRHLFDGYATLVRVSFRDGHAVGAHRQIESEAYKAARAHGKVCYREFSEVPKADSFLSYVGQLATLFSGSSLTDNSNTGVVRLGDGRVLCLTETIKGSIVVDPDTLDTLGKFEYTDKLGGLIHSAHPIVTDTEFWTLVPDLIRPGYSVVRMDAGTNERRFVGRVDCRGGPAPGWVHSFPITDHYVVVPEMPLRYCARNLLRAEPTPLYKFEWHLESGSYMHVMCKASGRVVASVEVPPYVTFHFINAYEEKDVEGRVTAIVADCCEHNANTSILDKLRLQNLRSSTGQDVLPDARYCTVPPCSATTTAIRNGWVSDGPAVLGATGWAGSGSRWTGARSASWSRRWTRTSTAAGWTCAASTRPTSARSTGTPTPAAPSGRATSPTPSPRSTWWRRRPRTGTRRALYRQSPSSCRAPAPWRRTTVST